MKKVLPKNEFSSELKRYALVGSNDEHKVTQRIEVVGLSQAKDWLSRFSLDHDNFVS